MLHVVVFLNTVIKIVTFVTFFSWLYKLSCSLVSPVETNPCEIFRLGPNWEERAGIREIQPPLPEKHTQGLVAVQPCGKCFNTEKINVMTINEAQEH